MTKRIGRLVRALPVLFLVCWYGAQSGVLPAAASPEANVIRVAPSGQDVPDCGSEALPCQTIQYAVNKAQPDDTIRVAEGIYTWNPSDFTCQSRVGAHAVVCVKNTRLTILGGYSTDHWGYAEPDQHPTIIDGQNAQRGVFVLNTAGTTRLQMEGFTIQNGLGRGIPGRTGDDAIFAYGGGMFVALGGQAVQGNEIVLRRMVFRNNQAIGENTSRSYGGSGVGGGLAVRSAYQLTLEHVVFEGNRAQSGTGAKRSGYAVGGGFHADRSHLFASHLTFINNVAISAPCSGNGRDTDGQSGDALGGGFAFHGYDATLQHVLAEGNQALGGNATQNASMAFGGALYVENGTLTVLDSVLRHNLVRGGDGANGALSAGGGIDAHNSSLFLERVQVIANTSRGGNAYNASGNAGSPGGGGIYIADFTGNSVVRITNSVIANNSVEFGDVGSTLVGGGGGGLWLQGTDDAIITHTTIAANQLNKPPMQGHAVLLLKVGTPAPSVVQFRYTIVADHKADVGVSALYVQQGCTARLERTLWAGNAKATAGEGSIQDSNPLFASSARFISPGPPRYDYHIDKGSAAKDQAVGSPVEVDIDGDERTSDTPDIGADEYVQPALVLRTPRPSSQSLQVRWEANSTILSKVHHYHLIVTCGPGASPPAEGTCGAPINAGLNTRFTLTGLTNEVPYTIVVEARDAANGLLATSNPVVGTPLELDWVQFVPVVFNRN